MTGFAALAVDLGYAFAASAHLQAVVDAAALGGIAELDGTEEGVAFALSSTLAVANANRIFSHTVALTEENIVTGNWDEVERVFVATSDPVLVNALQVEGRVD